MSRPENETLSLDGGVPDRRNVVSFPECYSRGIVQRRLAAFTKDDLPQIDLRLVSAIYVLTTWSGDKPLHAVTSSLHWSYQEAEAAFDLAIGSPDLVKAEVVSKGRKVMVYERL